MRKGYVPGFSHNVDFGGGWESDSCGYCLYGDVAHPAAQWAMDAATAQHPDQAALSDHQKVSFWFRFKKLRPYGEVSKSFNQIADLLIKNEWRLADSVDGYPDTGCSIDDLSDTVDNPEFWSKPEADFPAEPNVQGYNAAKSFCIVVERLNNKPVFLANEVTQIEEIFVESMKLVYGQTLPKVER